MTIKDAASVMKLDSVALYTKKKILFNFLVMKNKESTLLGYESAKKVHG